MKVFLDGSGVDQTAAVIAALQGNAQPLCADLLQIKTAIQGAPWSKNYLYSISCDRALTWSHVGTFVPGKIARGGIECTIGLETQTFEFDWSLDGTEQFFQGVSIIQAFRLGLFDNAIVTLYRTAMPTFGDCNTWGAANMFTGRIANTTPTRTGVHVSVNSLTELFDQQLPPNLIQSADPQAQYGTGQPPSGLVSAPTFTVATGSTTSIVMGDCTGPSGHAGDIFTADIFDFGYIEFTSGNNQGLIASIRRSASASGHNQFYLYEPLPFPVTVGAAFTAYVPYVRSSTKSTSETHSVPASAPYSVTVSADFVASVGVVYTGGTAMALVSGSPVAGQFAVTDTGTYIFSAADAGVSVTISYAKRNVGTVGFPYIPSPETSL